MYNELLFLCTYRIKKSDNILVAYPTLTTFNDTLYIGGKTSFLACNTLTIIFIAIEMIILFSGRTMFREKSNMISNLKQHLDITLHFIGAILYASYGFQKWSFQIIWALWAPLR